MNLFTYNTAVSARLFAVLTAVSMIISALPVHIFVASADHDADGQYEGQILDSQSSVTICHSAGGSGNYSKPPTNVDGIVTLPNGHNGHSEDIIPPFHYDLGDGELSYPGKNWDSAGIAIWENNCVVPAEPVPGCTDIAADNYNPDATVDDGSCTYPPVLGCTDPVATNYNPEATEGNANAAECTYPEAKITLLKEFSYGDADPVYDSGDFTFYIEGGEVTLGVPTTTIPGTFTISESGPVSEFDLSIECDGGSLTGADLTVADTDDVTCTLTNTFRTEPVTTGTLVVEKVITDGSNASQSFDFSGSLGDFALLGGESTSSELTVANGPFTVSESVPSGWTQESAVCVYGDQSTSTPASIDIAAGETVTCTFTNDEDAVVVERGTLVVQKVILGDTLATSSDFSFLVDGTGTTTFEADGQNDLVLTPGSYSVTEVVDAAFTTTYSNDQNSELNCDNLSVVDEGTVTCTITNRVIPGPQPVCEVGDNLLVNASFEEPIADDKANGDGFWELFDVIPGWISDGSFEVWNNMFGGASDGEQNLELDVVLPTTITQSVVTIPGATYELRFDFAARDANEANNSIEAAADGSVIVSTSTDNTDWVEYSNTFVAGDASTDITFTDKGTPNGTGTLLDNAVLCLVSEPEPEPELSCDIFTASPEVTSPLGNVTLNWETTLADFVSIDQGVGEVATSGTAIVNPANDTTYTLTARQYTDEESQEPTYNEVTCDVFVDVRSGGGGGGSSSPRCDLFDAEVDGDEITLTWETRRGYDLTIEADGEEVYDETDNDVVDEGSITIENNGQETFELTVFRDTRNDSCTVDLTRPTPTPQVLGEQVSVVPTGAPNAGAGGSSLPAKIGFTFAPVAFVGRMTRKNA